jgi:hypothetical protein
MVHDLISFGQTLRRELEKNELIQKLAPIFTLMGSVAEGTRLCLGNETDIMMEFGKFDKPAFKVVEKDPFHLYATDNAPQWMTTYFDEDSRFILCKFMHDLLNIASSCIDRIFKEKTNPKRLMRKTTNTEFNRNDLKCEGCKKRRQEENVTLFKQCKNCIVTVSQTKIGIGLQFLWKSVDGLEIYCSVDLVPTFKIIGISPLELAKIVNSAMIYLKPNGWMKYLTKYAKTDLIVIDLIENSSESQMIQSVILKNINCSLDQNYFVRPGQYLGREKFKSEEHKKIYLRIKALKTILDIELDNYMLKKLLLKPIELRTDILPSDFISDFFHDVMCQPELREKFESRIAYEFWPKRACRSIPLKM